MSFFSRTANFVYMRRDVTGEGESSLLAEVSHYEALSFLSVLPRRERPLLAGKGESILFPSTFVDTLQLPVWRHVGIDESELRVACAISEEHHSHKSSISLIFIKILDMQESAKREHKSTTVR